MKQTLSSDVWKFGFRRGFASGEEITVCPSFEVAGLFHMVSRLRLEHGKPGQGWWERMVEEGLASQTNGALSFLAAVCQTTQLP